MSPCKFKKSKVEVIGAFVYIWQCCIFNGKVPTV